MNRSPPGGRRTSEKASAIRLDRLDKLKRAIDAVWRAGAGDELASRSEIERLAGIIREIRVAEECRVVRDTLPEARAVLNALSGGIPVPTLAVCGHGTQEVRFTQYLAWFMEPTNPHGLGNRIVKAVAGLSEAQGRDLQSAFDDGSDVEVRPEANIGPVEGVQCVPDIVVVTPGCVLVLEQKIRSAEGIRPDGQGYQLLAYDTAIANVVDWRQRRILRLFLTPTGKRGSSPHWLPVSHADLIGCLLPILSSPEVARVGRENLRRLLFELALGPLDSTIEALQRLQDLARRLVTNATGCAVSDGMRFSQLLQNNRLLYEIMTMGAQND